MNVTEALVARRSVRAFRPEPVAEDTLREIFSAAQHAPSWCNIQPWRVVLTSGEATLRVTRALTEAATSAPPSPDFAWPGEYPEPYNTHRRACGKALYDAMGVARGDAEGRHQAWMRNYVAFDAPHIAFVSVDRRIGPYAMLDVGCWLQSLLLAAWERGVACCPQASLSTHPDAIRAMLAIPDTEGLLFGIAVGYEIGGAPANACRTTRATLDANVRFLST
jgi:nitroreductase